MWLELILGYCRAHSTFEIDANDSSFALWHNEKIKRTSCVAAQTDDSRREAERSRHQNDTR